MAERPRILDLFCGAGGCAKGYHDAGFDVIGVDIKPQPNYPFTFRQQDALEFLDECMSWPSRLWFDAVHASPPCQSFTAYRRKGHGVGDGYPNLIPLTRELLEASGLPYVIENVTGARSHLVDPVMFCGSSFGLDVRRHRLFETNFPLEAPPCDHAWQTPRFPAATNRKPHSRRTVEIGVWRIPLEVQQRAMRIDWMTLPELSEAIPPAYTAHIGDWLWAELSVRMEEAA
jgi:DNA (cytosine-5)-methyltransferase 1